MGIEPESLVAWLIIHIACSSWDGCSVAEVLDHAQRLLHDSSKSKTFAEVPLKSHTSADEAFERTVWQWLTSRSDVFVGRGGEWNHLTLDEISSLPADPSSTANVQQTGTPVGANWQEDGTGAETEPRQQKTLSVQSVSKLPLHQPKLYVSEDRAWESIAGHGVDHQRVPKSQWDALLGIASAGKEGIIQGDLRRLIGQDKRSLPHRTDLLAQRGYVVKRTTLIKGCKTSKIWLKRFAPDLPRNTLGPDDSGLSGDMANESLASSDEPVPWHKRWTGGPMDMVALGKTIMAVIKAWGVMRFSDLKAKLGVKGRKWEMRVVARCCRFLAMRGCIKYVVATWGGRLLRDCVKFSRDLGPEDWAAFLCTGMTPRKSRDKPTQPSSSSKLSKKSSSATKAAATTAKVKSAANPTKVVWTPDEPFGLTISRLVHTAGHEGLGTPELVDMTLGPSFRRYVSSASSALAVRGVQPPQLRHLEICRELRRVGKAAVFRFFPTNKQAGEGHTTTTEANIDPALVASPEDGATEPSISNFGFGAPTRTPDFRTGQAKLEDMAADTGVYDKRGPTGKKRKSCKARGRGRELSARNVGHDQGDDATDYGSGHEGGPISKRGSGRTPRVRGVGRGRGRKVVGATSGGKYKCEKCGNSWKNDVGLKYHLTKAKTSCNPSWIEEDPPPTRPAGLDRTTPSRTVEGAVVDGQGSPVLPGRSNSDDATSKQEQLFMPTAEEHSKSKHGGDTNISDLPGSGPELSSDPIALLRPDEGPQDDPQNLAATAPTAPASGPSSHNVQGSVPEPAKPLKRKRPSNIWPPLHETPVATVNGSARPKSRHGQNSQGASASARPQFDQSEYIVPSQTLTPASASSRAVTEHERVEESTKQARRTVRFHDDPVFTSQGAGIDSNPAAPAIIDQDTPSPQHTWTTPEPTATTVAESVPHQSQAVIPSGAAPTPFPMPVFEHGKRKTAEQIVSSRISAILVWLVDCLGGLFPGGKALWVSAGTSWQHYFPDDPCPTDDRFAVELRKLVGKRMLREISQWFRDPGSTKGTCGSLVSCQLVTRASFDLDSDELGKVVTAIKRAYPDPYIPQFMLHGLPQAEEHSQDPVLTFTGRRMIVGKVEVLSAPFYASGPPARKKQLPRQHVPGSNQFRLDYGYIGSSGRDDEFMEHSRKHRRSTRRAQRDDANAAAGSGSPAPPAPETEVLWADEDSDMGDAEMCDSDEHTESCPATKPRPNFKFRFLKPNTYLEKDYTVGHGKAAFLDDDDEGDVGGHNGHDNDAAVSLGTRHERTVDTLFVPTKVLDPSCTDTSGPHALYGRKWFEASDNSFTVKAWAPDRAWLDLEAFPVRVQGLLARRITQLGGLAGKTQEVAHRRFVERATAIHHMEMRPPYFPPTIVTCGWPHRVFVHLENIATYPVPDLKAPLRWGRDNQLTVESASRIYAQANELEGESAEDSDWVPEAGVRKRRRPTATSRARGRGGRRGGGGGGHYKSWRARPPAKETLKHRYMTTLPDPAAAPTVEPTSTIPPAAIQTISTNLKKQDEVFLAAFVVVRTLLGGTGEAIDWGLMLHLFPHSTLDGLRRSWARCRKFRSGFMSKLTAKFQRAFIRAYERDEVPGINFDDIRAYDWMGLVKWALAIRVEEDVQLPVTRKSLCATHVLRDDPDRQQDDWQDKFFHPQSSIFSRLEAATCEPAALSLRTLQSPDHAFRQVRSLIKAFSGTPAGRYPNADIRSRFAPFRGRGGSGTALLERAVRELTAQKAISKSEKNMRHGPHPYRLSEQFHGTLAKLGQAKKYREATRFKQELDAAAARQARLRLPYTVQDGATMAYINLQAHHRVAIQPVGVPEVPFGFEPGKYETRKFSKKYYRFGLEIAPTTDYLPTNAIAAVDAATKEPPPNAGPNGEMPVWCDIFGVLDKSRWAHLIGGLFFLMATRGSLPVASVCKAMRPLVDEFEVELMVGWAKKVGIMEEIYGGAGLAMTEWWWLVVPTQYTGDS